MTKTAAADQLFQDFIAGQLWLQINNWLDEDLITMSMNFYKYDQSIR